MDRLGAGYGNFLVIEARVDYFHLTYNVISGLPEIFDVMPYGFHARSKTNR
jgi:hypothetical protein